MDLALTDEQSELVTSFANLLSKVSPPERVRAAEPAGFDGKVWGSLVDMGAVPMAVPEARGGWGASLLGHARRRELAAMAFAFASGASEAATYDAVHVHGGYGFMIEHDVQLHYRRVRGWARVWGDADAGYRRAAAARYGATAERER